MSRSIIVHYEGKPCYEIAIEPDFGKLAEKLQNLGYRKEQKICVITDNHVEPLYLESLKKELRKCFNTVCSCFPGGRGTEECGNCQPYLSEADRGAL